MADSISVALTSEQVENWRDARYHRRPHLRLRSSQQALEFINQVGFCFLFPAKKVEMPTLWEAICGETRPFPVAHDDVELGYAWNWKDELPSRGLVFYGKLLFKKPTLVSLALLPHFYALSENYGDIEDYLLEYQDGKLSEEAKRVYEALLQHGALPTSHLRRWAGLHGKGNAPRFDRAIRELQLGLKIVKTGISDANAWGYCYVYDVMLRHWPDLARRASAISTQEAMRVLLLTYLRNVGATTLADVVRLFGWDVLRLAALCQQWAASGELLSGVPVEGWAGDYLAWSSITSDMTAATCL
jgi:hypothetical protein